MNDMTLNAAESYLNGLFSDHIADNGNYAPYLTRMLKVLEWKGDIRSLRDALPYHAERLGFTDFLNTMSCLGYAPRIMQIHKDKLNEDMLPCLFVPKGGEAQGEMLFHLPVATTPATPQQQEETNHPHRAQLNGWLQWLATLPVHLWEVFTTGKPLFPYKEEQAPGTVYIFKENRGSGDIITDKTLANSSLKWFTKLLLRFRSVFRQVLVASLVINLLALATPIFMMNVYDKVIGAHSAQTLKYLLVGVVLAVGVEFALRFLRSRSLSWFGARLDSIVSNALLERILTLPASFTERASVAAQLSRIKAFESVREFFTGSLFLSFVELPFALILLTAIALIAGPLAVIPLIVAGLYAILLLIMNPRLKALTTRMATASAERQTMHIETLSKQQTLRSAGGFNAWLERYEKAGAEASFASYGYNRAVAVIDTVSQGLLILGGIAMIYFGVERIWAEKMSTGGMIAILILSWRTLTPLQTACTSLPRLAQVQRNIEQINRLMDMTPERAPYSVAQDAPQFRGEIEFHNVGLRYSKDADPVYAGLSFKVEAGQMVAIVGSNSTGKSTTLHLVSGLYQPQAGAIRIDGVDIRQIDRLKLRQNIAYVGQVPDFFTGTVRENLHLVQPDATDDDLVHVMEQAGMTDWLQTLPQGLDTLLGDNGAMLPTSLRPKFALARAYLQDSTILLIDEMPYEFLNSEHGQYFLNYLKEQKGRRTILYVTYRQDYIALADMVVQLYHDGRPQVKWQKQPKGASHV